MNCNPLTGLSRRDFLRLSALGVGGAAMSGWMGVLAARAAEAGVKHKSCILLYMEGGPSHIDTFDMKPGAATGGEFRPIQTAVPGMQISEHLPQFAKLTKDAVLIRSMSTSEGAHGRARYFMHTGYREGQGGLSYPSIGAIASAELGQEGFPLPNFVAVNGRSYGSGYLGPRHQPLFVQDPDRGVENLRPLVGNGEFNDRMGLLEEMEQAFYRDYKVDSSVAHETTYRRAVEMMKSKEAKAFDLTDEPAKVREAYGEGKFGQGCLLARRLIETGVPFVEVTQGGWDTHQNNFERVKNLSAELDPGMSALIRDLKDRGRLDDTLIVWMGEFGRTPKINARGAQPGRDHYPRAWSTLLVGGGLKTGQVIGKTDAEGAEVVGKKTSATDFLASVCKALGIDYAKVNNTPIGRPVRIVDKAGEPIKELFA
ncbi:MAG TPA: DUF1501 domain-containing protein [Gemmataceae bacterium]|nr:DUF1501 domain-containing protein [Gemmataceae bacterium]